LDVFEPLNPPAQYQVPHTFAAVQGFIPPQGFDDMYLQTIMATHKAPIQGNLLIIH
jgi:hypothetical protein